MSGTGEWTAEDRKALETAVRSYDRVAAEELCGRLVKVLERGPQPFDEKEAKGILNLLRRKRFFALMERVADALVGAGNRGAAIRRQLAQALIDQGKLSLALAVLTELLADTGIPPAERAEARGLVGRVHKQRYVNAPSAAQKPALERAITEYRAVYEGAPAIHLWHGINAVALKLRAERDGLADVHPDFDARSAAADIVAVIEAKPDGGRAYWDLATAAEACVALGDAKRALDWLTDYLADDDADAFEFGSCLRQLQEVWGIDEQHELRAMVVALKTALLQREGGALSLSHGELQRTAEAAHDPTIQERLERVFGPNGPLRVGWIRDGLSAALAVGRVEDLGKTTIGTCFLVRAGDFFPKLARVPAGELLVLTNSHVLGTRSAKALPPSEATIRFDELKTPGPFAVKELLWESAVGELDATFVRVDPPPQCDAAMRIAPELEPGYPSEPPRQLLVIGHPRGDALSMSLSDNLQVGWQPPRVHYRTPTEPGSSGSPVFDGGWRLIALHRSARERIARPGATEYYEANEGIWIHAIRRRTAEVGTVIALAGRRVSPDAGGSLPLSRVPELEAALRRRLGSELAAAALVSSAACGADLVALGVAGELKMRRRVVLPFPADVFRAKSVVDRPDERWGRAYDALLRELTPRGDVVVLPGAGGSDDDAYLRANGAIFDEALRLAAGRAEDVVAVVVWEGKSKGPSDATAQFEETAKMRGIRVEVVPLA